MEVVDLYLDYYYIEVEKAGEGVELPLRFCATPPPTTLILSTPDCANSPTRALGTETSRARSPQACLDPVRNRALLAWDRVERDQAWKDRSGEGSGRAPGCGAGRAGREAGPGKFAAAPESWPGLHGTVKGWGGGWVWPCR